MNPIRHKLSQDQQLFRVGDAQSSFYLLLSGIISLYQTRDGRTLESARCTANSVVDEIAYFAPRHRQVSAKAVTDCELLEFRFEDITAAMKTLPPWASIMLRNLGERAKSQRPPTDETTQQTLDLILRGVLITRVALTSLSADAGRSHAWEKVREYAFQTFNLPLSRLEPVVRRLGEMGWLKLTFNENELSEMSATDDGIARLMKLEEFIRLHRHSQHSQILEMSETDELLLTGLVNTASKPDIAVHRDGGVKIPMDKALTEVHALPGGDKIRADHFDLLQARGIDLRKQSTDQGVVIAFQLSEGREVLENTKFLRGLTKSRS